MAFSQTNNTKTDRSVKMQIRYTADLKLGDKTILVTSLDRSVLSELIIRAQQAGMISEAPAIRAIRVSEIIERANTVRCERR